MFHSLMSLVIDVYGPRYIELFQYKDVNFVEQVRHVELGMFYRLLCCIHLAVIDHKLTSSWVE